MCGGGEDNGFMFAQGKSEKLSVNTMGAGHTTKKGLLKDPMKWFWRVFEKVSTLFL